MGCDGLLSCRRLIFDYRLELTDRSIFLNGKNDFMKQRWRFVFCLVTELRVWSGRCIDFWWNLWELMGKLVTTSREKDKRDLLWGRAVRNGIFVLWFFCDRDERLNRANYWFLMKYVGAEGEVSDDLARRGWERLTFGPRCSILCFLWVCWFFVCMRVDLRDWWEMSLAVKVDKSQNLSRSERDCSRKDSLVEVNLRMVSRAEAQNDKDFCFIVEELCSLLFCLWGLGVINDSIWECPNSRSICSDSGDVDSLIPDAVVWCTWIIVCQKTRRTIEVQTMILEMMFRQNDETVGWSYRSFEHFNRWYIGFEWSQCLSREFVDDNLLYCS